MIPATTAATFAATVLPDLAKVDVGAADAPVNALNQTAYVCGVSGGSLAPANPALHNPARSARVLSGKRQLSQDYGDAIEVVAQNKDRIRQFFRGL
jgi:hypothetical protein